MIARPPFDAQPTHEFWMHWVNLARVWAMLAGRADSAASSAKSELEAWERPPLVNPTGWDELRGALQRLYMNPEQPRGEFVAAAASRVWDPIEALGREAWGGS